MGGRILALDLGTTGNRAIIFDGNQRVVASAYEEFHQIYPRPGWVEHDPEAIWRSALSVMRRALKKSPDVAAIGVTNQRETIVLWDRRTGRPVHRAIVWQDRRTAGTCERLKKKGLSRPVHRRTGLFLDPYFSGTKLQWLLQNVPGAARRAAQGCLAAGTIDSWIIWKLSGGRAHVTDTSNASRTMLFNLRSMGWDPWLCRLFGVPKAVLPRIVPSSGEAARSARKWLGREIPITGIVGDQQAASFAQGCYAPGIVKNTYGTGLFAVENTGGSPKFSKDLLTTVAWTLGGRTEYALEGSVFVAGAAIQWLRDGIGLLKDSRDSARMAASLASNEDVYFVPALVGLGAPYWDPYARGTLLGITRGTGPAHLARAALEAIAYQTRDILSVMERETGRRLERLRVDGGAAANDWLMQFQADLLGIPVERPRILETTALGAAGLAGIAAGVWKDRNQFHGLRKVDRIFKPRGSRKDHERLYNKWKEAVTRSRGWDVYS